MTLQYSLHKMLAVCALACGFTLQAAAQEVADTVQQEPAVSAQAMVADTAVQVPAVQAADASKEAKASKRKRHKTDDKAVKAASVVQNDSVQNDSVTTHIKHRKQKEPKAEKKEPPFSFNFQAVEDYW